MKEGSRYRYDFLYACALTGLVILMISNMAPRRRRIRVEAASGMQSQLDEARRILESERAARVEAEARLDAVKEEAAARLEAAESRMNSFRSAPSLAPFFCVMT